MRCYHCKEEMYIVWALASHGRAYCSQLCFQGRTENASTSTSAYAEPSNVMPAVPEGRVHVEVQQGHQ